MTGHPIRRPSRWQAERSELRDRAHREVVAAELTSTLPPPLTDEQVVSFTGQPGRYVQTSAEARAHAWATSTAARWHDCDGLLIVAVDERGAVVEVGPGRWP